MWLQQAEIPSQSDSSIFTGGSAFGALCGFVILICLLLADYSKLCQLKIWKLLLGFIFIAFTRNWWCVYFGKNSLSRRIFFQRKRKLTTIAVVNTPHTYSPTCCFVLYLYCITWFSTRGHLWLASVRICGWHQSFVSKLYPSL